MIRTLLIIAGAALVLCLVTAAGAFGLGGRDLAHNGWTWTWIEGRGDGSAQFSRGRPSEAEFGPDITRDTPWTGGDSLTVDLPADVVYVQGPANSVRVTGPQNLVDLIKVEGGRIYMDQERGERVTVTFDRNGVRALSDIERLSITVTAPSVTRFSVNGSEDLEIQAYDQDTLTVAVSGSGGVQAQGRARALMLDVTGSGRADLEDLIATDATISVTGSGNATVNASGSVDANVSGSGDIELTRRPARLNSNVSGSGNVDESF